MHEGGAGTPKDGREDARMRIATYNVNGVGARLPSDHAPAWIELAANDS